MSHKIKEQSLTYELYKGNFYRCLISWERSNGFFYWKHSPKREIKKIEIILKVSDFEGFQSQEGKGENLIKVCQISIFGFPL
jgi:hypothetical protein